MSAYDTDANECIDLEDNRDVRALEQYLTVTPDIGRARGADDLALVTSESGTEYLVDVSEGSCQQKNGEVCPDQQYNLEAGEKCKHVRRARIAMGEQTVSAAALADVGVDPRLGEHTNGPQVVTSDGGVVTNDDTTVREAADGAEILENDDVDPWEGPFAEYDRYGHPTGSKYRRCRDCGLEVHTDVDRESVSHRDGCRFADNNSDQDDVRHEPADFGGDESTGVIDL